MAIFNSYVSLPEGTTNMILGMIPITGMYSQKGPEMITNKARFFANQTWRSKKGMGAIYDLAKKRTVW